MKVCDLLLSSLFWCYIQEEKKIKQEAVKPPIEQELVVCFICFFMSTYMFDATFPFRIYINVLLIFWLLSFRVLLCHLHVGMVALSARSYPNILPVCLYIFSLTLTRVRYVLIFFCWLNDLMCCSNSSAPNANTMWVGASSNTTNSSIKLCCRAMWVITFPSRVNKE